MTPLAVDWHHLEPPRSPVAVFADGLSARGLIEGATRRLASGSDVRVAVGDDTVLVLGEVLDLPWAPGVTYLGRELGVLVPTTRSPSVPLDLLAVAVRQLLARQGVPYQQLVLLPGRVVTFGVADTPPDAAELRRYALGVSQ